MVFVVSFLSLFVIYLNDIDVVFNERFGCFMISGVFGVEKYRWWSIVGCLLKILGDVMML